MTNAQKSINNFYEFSGLDRIINSHLGYEFSTKEDVYAAVLEDVEEITQKPASIEIKNYVRFVVNKEIK
ncbi:hypothetical protein OS347_000728 [Vibrio vulnificus]|nr:hypothetical protein [Vibrio vulnificus]